MMADLNMTLTDKPTKPGKMSQDMGSRVTKGSFSLKWKDSRSNSSVLEYQGRRRFVEPQQFLWGLPYPDCIQTELLSFIKASIEGDCFSSRIFISECLRDLIMKVTKNPDEPVPKLPQLKWTSQLIDVLKELLVLGADPTWTPDLPGHHESAQFSFLRAVFNILAQIKKPLAIELGELLPFFLTEKCPKHRESRGTLLHALLNQPYPCSFKNYENLCKKFGELVYIVTSPENIDAKDCDGRTPLHLLTIGLFEYIKTLPNILSVFDHLKTPENLNMKDYDERTPLHLFTIEVFKHDIETLDRRTEPPNILSFFDHLKTPENVIMKDCDGRTPLHLLAIGLFEAKVKVLETLSVFSLLITPQNVNCEDNHSVIPYSWILIGKTKWEDDPSMQKLFLDIEEKLIENGADAEKARSAVTVPILRWMEEEFIGNKWTEKRFERLLGCMEAIPNWKDHHYRLHLNDDAIWHLRMMENARWIAIVMKIIRVVSKNETTAQDIWDALMAYNVKKPVIAIRLNMLEMLSICAEAGAQPTYKQLDYIRSGFKIFTRNGEWAELYLKILVSSNKEKHGLGTFDLSFLGEFYQVSPKLVQLAKALVRSMYYTWDECVESRQLINYFLFITNEQEMLNDEVIEAATCDNWMRRSPLHLAVILLDSLELLSHGIIKKYIEARDVHGCTSLHLAHLHQNKHAVNLLERYVKKGTFIDHFGVTPRNMPSSIGDQNKKTYEDCCKIVDAKKDIMKLLKPMIVMSEDEADDLSDKLKILFERLISETEFKEARIQIAGSMRERTKCGSLDEIDIQILLNKADIKEHGKDEYDILKKLSFALRDALPKISWEGGIYIRPIDISGPWKLIREGRYRGMEISLDVVLVFIGDVIYGSEISFFQQKIIQEAPLHKQMRFQTLEPWNESKEFKETMFEYEWDIIDSLPMPCRLAIVLAKAIVKAYDCVRGNNSLCEKNPITSYTIKTALFCLLAHDGSGRFDYNLKVALDEVKGEPRTEKLQFNPNAKWVNAEDLLEHREEARVWAQDIFLLIKYLALDKWQLTDYWQKKYYKMCIKSEFGEPEYALKLCDFALEKLMINAF